MLPLAARLACCAALGSTAAQAGVSYELALGAMRDSSGTALPDGTVVVLIADSDGGAGLPGGLDGSDLSQSGLDPATAFAHFAGKTLSVGNTINGDSIFYVGQVNSDVYTFPAGMLYEPALNYTDYPSGLADGQAFGVYWFPGVTAAGTTLPTDSFQVGGFHNPAPNTGASNAGMTLQVLDPAGNYTVYQLDAATAGSFLLESATAAAAFTALEVAAPADDFAAWINGFFPGETDPAIVGFDADPDHDGVPNGTESALGTAPDTRSAALTAPAATPGSLVFATTLAKDLPSDVTRAWQWSRNLVDWHADGASDGSITVGFGVMVTDGSNPLFDAVQVTATATGGTPPVLFARLVATQTAP